MRLLLTLISLISLCCFSLESNAQNLEVIVGSENNFNDYAYAIAVDEAKQCIYVAGSLEVSAGQSIDPHDFFNINSIQGNVDQPSTDAYTAQGGEDLFIAKFDLLGNLHWFISGGGPDDDAILDIIVGSDGNVYLTGFLSFPSSINYTSDVSTTDFEAFGDNQNAVVISINDAGELRWMDRLGSDEDNTGLELVDSEDGIAVSGLFTNSSDTDDDSSNNIEVFGLELPDEDDWKGAYIAKINYAGQCQWYRAYTSPSFSYDLSDVNKLTGSLDTDGDSYYLITILSGDSNYRCYSYEDGSPINNGPQLLASGTSIALFKISAEGELQWSRTELLPSGVIINSGPFVSVSCEEVYITATLTTSVSVPLTISAGLNLIPSGSFPTILFQRRAATTGQSELVRLFPAGSNTSDNYVTAIESDVQKRVYLAGATSDNIIFESTNNTANISSNGNSKNAWIKSMTRDTDNLWTQTINGNQSDEFTDIFLRGLGFVYFTGFTSSQTGLSMSPFGGSDPSSIYGKYSQSTTTGLSDFSLICPSTLTLNSNTECGLENYTFPEIQIINDCVVEFQESDIPQVLPFGSTVITFEAIGFNGSTQQCTTNVFVENVSLDNSLLCVPEVIRNTDENSCFATVSLINPVISGNCEPVTLTNNFNNSASITNAVFPVGTTTVTWTAFFHADDDEEGGLVPITCNTKVLVNDITAPTMECINNLSLSLTSEGTIGVSIDQIDGGSFDACNDLELTISKTEFDCSNIGPNQVILTAIDASGNSNSCTATVTVVDNIIPTAQCNNIELELSASGTASINPDQINNNSFDNCSISNIFLSQSEFNCSHLGENNITLTVTDASGLLSTCTAQILVIDPSNPPTVDAGSDITICANAASVTLQPVVSKDSNNILWSGGSGTFTNGVNSADNTYIPSAEEIQAGSVVLTLTAFGNSVCGSTSDQIVISFSNAPTAFAGTDLQVCSDESAALNTSTATNQTTVFWSGGTGTFAPSADILQPNYTPTPEEFANGSVTLTLTVQGGVGCQPVSDDITIELAVKPLADAGSDQNVCGNSKQLNASVPSLGVGTWSSNQDVTFTPGVNDPNANVAVSSFGNYTLTWTVVNEFCTSVDEVLIVFSEPPSVFAGEDQQVCSDQVVLLNGATANNQVSVQWSGGAGTFSPSADILQPTYTPTLDEFLGGSVALTITALGNPGCAPATDEIVIALAKKPIAEAGADQEICGNSVFLDGNAPPHGVGTWTASESVNFIGSINDPTAQVNSDDFRSITFTWTVVNAFCTTVDDVTISFFQSPVLAEAGPDQTISYLGQTTLEAIITEIGQGVWTSNNSDVIFQDKEDANTNVSGLQPGSNVLYWIITNGPCSAVQDSVIIFVEGLVIPTGFSPNGDNINDTFEIKGIGNKESISIKVLNRWGEEVFASDNYKNDWNGISKSGSELPNDTYYCVIESPILEKTHTGYIIINR